MTDQHPVELGFDILRYDGNDEDILYTLSATRYRFLDKIWIPAQLNELTVEQIAVLNRFREKEFGEDPQFGVAKHSRAVFVDAVAAVGGARVLEVGCGKFPLAHRLNVEKYMAIEIDREAIAYCQDIGLDVRSLDEFEDPVRGQSDVVVASYVFHFSVQVELIKFLAANTSLDAVIIFNIIAEDAIHVLSMLSEFLAIWPVCFIVKSDRMARREYWLVLSTPAGMQRALSAKDSLERSWA